MAREEIANSKRGFAKAVGPGGFDRGHSPEPQNGKLFDRLPPIEGVFMAGSHEIFEDVSNGNRKAHGQPLSLTLFFRACDPTRGGLLDLGARLENPIKPLRHAVGSESVPLRICAAPKRSFRFVISRKPAASSISRSSSFGGK